MPAKNSAQTHSVKVKIKRFDTELPLPQYQSAGAAALDLVSRVDIEIPPQQVKLVPLNVAFELPAGYWALLAARSSLHKKGLIMANGIGVGDGDYCGDQDEYKAPLWNFTDQPVQVKRGDRLVQLMILPTYPIAWQEVSKLQGPNRGGFGSTG